MKRLDLVQLTIIIVGIFSAFIFLTSLPQFLYLIFAWFEDGLRGGYFWEILFRTVLVDGAYLLSAIYCIKKSKHFALWVSNNANLNGDINFALDKAEILFVLFVGLGLYGFIKQLPPFIVDGYNKIKGSNTNGFITRDIKLPSNSDLISQAIILFLFFVLVYYAKTFADFFASKINNVEPEDEIENKLID